MPPNEAVKSILADVSKFVNVTLKSESLSKKAENERTKLIEALEKFYAANYSLAPHSGDEGSTSSHRTPSISGSIEDSKNTIDSHGSDEDYDENIPPTNLRSLENPTKLGYMDYKKHREGQTWPSSWQKKRYFALHNRTMYCFKKPSDQKQTFAFLVSGYEINDSPQHTKDSKRKECCFELVISGKKSHLFLADSKDDLLDWKKHLHQALQADNSSSRENLEDDDDLYEPLPGDGESANTSSVPSEKVPPIQIIADEIPIEEEEDDIYDDGTVVDRSPSPVAPQASPKTVGAFMSKLFKRKDSESSEKKAKTEETTKPVDKEEASSTVVDEFGEEEEIYDIVGTGEEPGAGNPRPPPPAVPETPPPTKNEEPSSPKALSITSASQTPSNAPKLPSRGPVPSPVSPPTSPTPALPPRVPPGSQPPSLPDRDLPPLPERNLPPLPDRNLPPLPERNRQPRPPNIPVPPVPSSSAGSQAKQPQLDKSICHSREEDFENLYYSAYTCRGVSESELTFTRGDLIHIISRDLDLENWWVGELSGKIGLVPKAFLVPAYTEVN